MLRVAKRISLGALVLFAGLAQAEPIHQSRAGDGASDLTTTSTSQSEVGATCAAACYTEVWCDDGRIVGCYGSNPNACWQDGEYAVCNGQAYSCDQCRNDDPAAIYCVYC